MKKEKAFSWKGGDIPIIEPHSISRHKVLKHYVSEYIRKVSKLGYRRSDLHLTLIDGFAGGGKYRLGEKEHLGSPFILMQAAETVRAEILTNAKNFNLDIDYIFIEKNKYTYNFLKTMLEKELSLPIPSKKICLVNGEFNNNLERILHFIKNKHSSENCIFVLDPTGYTEMKNFFELFNYIFSKINKPEIIFTCQIDWLLHYISNDIEFPGTKSILQKMGIYQDIVDINKGKDVNEVDGHKRKSLREIVQIVINKKFQQMPFYTPFLITAPTSHKSYMLVHLAKHVRAREVMINTHWDSDLANLFIHEGKVGYNMLGYDPSKNNTARKSYLFDEASEKGTVNSLTENLIKQDLISDATSISSAFLYEKTCNKIPATRNMFYEVLKRLIKDKEIEAYNSKTGKKTISVQDGTMVRKGRNRKLF